MIRGRAYTDPCAAGVGLGLVLLAAFVITGRGLGASGAFATTAAGLARAIAPAGAQANPYFARYLAGDAGVALRGGCFCNPGAAEAAFGLDPRALAACLAASGDDVSPVRIAACLGRAVGAVRLSLGLANSRGDVARAAAVIASFAE